MPGSLSCPQPPSVALHFIFLSVLSFFFFCWEHHVLYGKSFIPVAENLFILTPWRIFRHETAICFLKSDTCFNKEISLHICRGLFNQMLLLSGCRISPVTLCFFSVPISKTLHLCVLFKRLFFLCISQTYK